MRRFMSVESRIPHYVRNGTFLISCLDWQPPSLSKGSVEPGRWQRLCNAGPSLATAEAAEAISDPDGVHREACGKEGVPQH